MRFSAPVVSGAGSAENATDAELAAAVATLSGQVRGLPLPAPTASEDGFGFVYDDATQGFLWVPRSTGDHALNQSNDQTGIQGPTQVTGMEITFDVAPGAPMLVAGTVAGVRGSVTGIFASFYLTDETGVAGLKDAKYSPRVASLTETVTPPPVFEYIDTPGAYTRRLYIARGGGATGNTLSIPMGAGFGARLWAQLA